MKSDRRAYHREYYRANKKKWEAYRSNKRSSKAYRAAIQIEFYARHPEKRREYNQRAYLKRKLAMIRDIL